MRISTWLKAPLFEKTRAGMPRMQQLVRLRMRVASARPYLWDSEWSVDVACRRHERCRSQGEFGTSPRQLSDEITLPAGGRGRGERLPPLARPEQVISMSYTLLRPDPSSHRVLESARPARRFSANPKIWHLAFSPFRRRRRSCRR